MTSLVAKAPVCVAWSQNWAGRIGSTVAFRVQRLTASTYVVGYFVYWSSERPWGANSITRQLVPALAIDAFYSHLMFVLPGIQRIMYGPGDIEGFRVVYHLDDSDRLVPAAVFADDGHHREQALALDESLDEHNRVVVLADVWSHQMGGRAAALALRSGVPHRCYQGATLRPLTAHQAAAFRLGSEDAPLRARPAWSRAISTNAQQLSSQSTGVVGGTSR